MTPILPEKSEQDKPYRYATADTAHNQHNQHIYTIVMRVTCTIVPATLPMIRTSNRLEMMLQW